MARTVRQALIEWGWQDLIPAAHEWTLDRRYVGAGFPTPVVANDDPTQAARLFVVCGGDVLFKLPGDTDRGGASIYVVRDDEPGKSWEATRRRLSPNGEYFDGYHTPRPGPYLKIVATA